MSPRGVTHALSLPSNLTSLKILPLAATVREPVALMYVSIGSTLVSMSFPIHASREELLESVPSATTSMDWPASDLTVEELILDCNMHLLLLVIRWEIGFP